MKLRNGIPAVLMLAALAVAEPAFDLFDKSNLVAWCIVPFDAKKRGPEERAAMLERLGIRKLAYDYRDQHLSTFDAELDALTRHGITLQAFWLRTGPNPAEHPDTKAVFEFIERRKLKTEIWYWFKEPADFTALPEEKRFEESMRAVRYVAERAAKSGNRVGIYNHEGWFGEPENQMAIINRLGLKNVGMVYNFHHGHEHMDRFAKTFPSMVPYLMAVNINGMKKGGETILPVGQGDREAELLRVIAQSKYRGPIGILGHRDKEDVEVALTQNLEGLARLTASPKDLQLFLLIGQSNMAGRGIVEAQDREPIPQVWKFDKEMAWAPAIDPVQFDKRQAGVSIARSFAKVLVAADPPAKIGLIPAAFGGTTLDQWKPGGKLYQDAVERTKAAQKSGKLRGILWHQGEGDGMEEATAVSYRERFAAFIQQLRTDLNAPDVPVLVGQLCATAPTPHRKVVDEQLALTPLKVPHSGFVSSEGLYHQAGEVHFNSAELRELGRRYGFAFLMLDGSWRASPASSH